MKIVKIIIISIVLLAILFLAFYKSDKIDIEGTWKPEKIILNNSTIFPTKFDSLFVGNNSSEIIIDEWKNTLNVKTRNESIISHYKILKNKNGNHIINLSSYKKELNGNFNLKVDTLFIDDLTYEIRVVIQSNSSLLKFSRKVNIKPWKPEYPRRGLP